MLESPLRMLQAEASFPKRLLYSCRLPSRETLIDMNGKPRCDRNEGWGEFPSDDVRVVWDRKFFEHSAPTTYRSSVSVTDPLLT